MIPQGAIDELTRLVLTNAIYFNAGWQHPFDEAMTADGPFYLLDGGQVKILVPRELAEEARQIIEPKEPDQAEE